MTALSIVAHRLSLTAKSAEWLPCDVRFVAGAQTRAGRIDRVVPVTSANVRRMAAWRRMCRASVIEGNASSTCRVTSNTPLWLI